MRRVESPNVSNVDRMTMSCVLMSSKCGFFDVER